MDTKFDLCEEMKKILTEIQKESEDKETRGVKDRVLPAERHFSFVFLEEALCFSDYLEPWVDCMIGKIEDDFDKVTVIKKSFEIEQIGDNFELHFSAKFYCEVSKDED